MIPMDCPLPVPILNVKHCSIPLLHLPLPTYPLILNVLIQNAMHCSMEVVVGVAVIRVTIQVAILKKGPILLLKLTIAEIRLIAVNVIV
ncbi:MAG: hypothetical protein HXS53_12035 [Theionarchaea archaeon]|nr:hypothetical protein [Theionarchaea archaeon]